MIEVHLSYHVLPGLDDQSYFAWMKKAIVPALTSKGIVEVRAYRNIRENQGVLVVGLWEKLVDWTVFSQSEGWQSLINTLQSTFANNVHIEIWGPSPVIPAPLRSHK